MDQSGPTTTTTSPAPGPARTCVGCRGVGDRVALLRVVAEPDERGSLHVVPDPLRRRPGRGAWLHPDPACLELAVRRKAFGRALRADVMIDVAALRAWVESEHDRP